MMCSAGLNAWTGAQTPKCEKPHSSHKPAASTAVTCHKLLIKCGSRTLIYLNL